MMAEAVCEMVSCKGFDDLPDEIGVKILRQVDPKERVKLEIVSKHFKTVIGETWLFETSFTISNGGESSERVTGMLNRCGQYVQSLYIENCFIAGDLMVVIAQLCPNLRFFGIFGSSREMAGVEFGSFLVEQAVDENPDHPRASELMGIFFASLPHLFTLYLDNCEIYYVRGGQFDFRPNFEFLETTQYITKLYLGSLSNFGNELFVSICMKLQQLKCLILRFLGLSATAVTEGICKLSGLEELWLEQCVTREPDHTYAEHQLYSGEALTKPIVNSCKALKFILLDQSTSSDAVVPLMVEMESLRVLVFLEDAHFMDEDSIVHKMACAKERNFQANEKLTVFINQPMTGRRSEFAQVSIHSINSDDSRDLLTFIESSNNSTAANCLKQYSVVQMALEAKKHLKNDLQLEDGADPEENDAYDSDFSNPNHHGGIDDIYDFDDYDDVDDDDDDDEDYPYDEGDPYRYV